MKPPQFRDPDEAEGARRISDQLGRDLEALGKSTARNVPNIDRTAEAIWNRNLRKPQEGWLMNLFQSLKSRPRLATALGVAVVAAVLLAVPVSYTRTTGYEARLALAGPLPQGTNLRMIADEFGKALQAEDISVHAGMGGSTLIAQLPVRARSTVQGITEAFAQELNDRGLEAEARIRPLTERVTGNVYAAAADQIVAIQVNSDGKTDEEIAEEIRSQLEDAGFANAFVDVEMGDGQMKIEMQMTKDSDDALGPIQVSIDGMEPPLPGDACSERAFELYLSPEGKTAEEIEAEIRAHLEALGIENPQIRVFEGENGLEVDCGDICSGDGMEQQFIKINIGDGCCPGDPTVNASPKSEQESKTWSEVKKKYK